MLHGNYQFQLTQWLKDTDIENINQLEQECLTAEPISLKLELDYKRAAALNPDNLANVSLNTDTTEKVLQLNEFCCFDGAKLVGYLGLSCFNGVTGEINGMVHPAYRRRGIFQKLMLLVLAECKQRKLKQVLLLTDKRSTAGIALVKYFGATIEHEEHEMVHGHVNSIEPVWKNTRIQLHKASNADSADLLRLDTSAFGADGARELQPELEEARGMTIFIARLNDKNIGKVNLQLIQGIGGIYGLCIHPDFQGSGYGRELLMQSCSWLKANGAHTIHLQVSTVNDNALHLYQSCGFDTVATMAYYEVDL